MGHNNLEKKKAFLKCSVCDCGSVSLRILKYTAASQVLILFWAFLWSLLSIPFQVAKAVSHSLNNCVNCLPGQKDVDMALKSIGEASKKLLIETVSLQTNLKLTVASLVLAFFLI